jgi:hypothetical protein
VAVGLVCQQQGTPCVVEDTQEIRRELVARGGRVVMGEALAAVSHAAAAAHALQRLRHWSLPLSVPWSSQEQQEAEIAVQKAVLCFTSPALVKPARDTYLQLGVVGVAVVQ